MTDTDPTEIPEYKLREEINTLASKLVKREEPAIGAEDCGVTPEDIDKTLAELQEKINQAREQARPSEHNSWENSTEHPEGSQIEFRKSEVILFGEVIEPRDEDGYYLIDEDGNDNPPQRVHEKNILGTHVTN